MALDTLHQIFTNNADLLAQIYRDPQITAYNRLEPRARTEDFARSLRAEIRDPNAALVFARLLADLQQRPVWVAHGNEDERNWGRSGNGDGANLLFVGEI